MDNRGRQAITKQEQSLIANDGAKAVFKKSTGSSGADGNRFLRNKRVEVCFSRAEFLKLVELAKLNHFKSNAEFVRDRVLNERAHFSVKEQLLSVMRLDKQVKRVGNNLNQIAKHLNGGGKLEQLIVENMVSALKDLKKLHAEARESVLKNVSGEGRDH